MILFVYKQQYPLSEIVSCIVNEFRIGLDVCLCYSQVILMIEANSDKTDQCGGCKGFVHQCRTGSIDLSNKNSLHQKH